MTCFVALSVSASGTGGGGADGATGGSLIGASAYAKALGPAASFAINANRLSLQDAAGREVAVFEAGSLTLAGTSWEVTACNNGKQAVVTFFAKSTPTRIIFIIGLLLISD